MKIKALGLPSNTVEQYGACLLQCFAMDIMLNRVLSRLTASNNAMENSNLNKINHSDLQTNGIDSMDTTSSLAQPVSSYSNVINNDLNI